MSQIALNGTDVQIARDTSYDVQDFGDEGQRAYVGEMRSDVRAHHRMLRVTTPMLATADKNTLVTILLGTQPLTVTGDMVGTSADFHARSIFVEPITADAWIVSFELHETDAMP